LEIYFIAIDTKASFFLKNILKKLRVIDVKKKECWQANKTKKKLCLFLKSLYFCANFNKCVCIFPIFV
jgi:hypothetical protein